ncbi:MAG: preprotein translocase subunit YajC [Deltaproteobacteria bacterium]|nr:preprotein translocase subunit YajC [Deltaproteobacteria bacterium]
MLTLAFAETVSSASTTATGGMANIQMFLPMILVFGIFYLLIIRPQAKQQKKHKALLSQIKKGDEVVTNSGIYGRVYGIADNIVTLEIAENIRVRIDKPQIARLKGDSPK